LNRAPKTRAGQRWWLWLPLLALAAWLALFGDKSSTSSAAVSLPTRVAPPMPATTEPVVAARAQQPASADSLGALVPREQLFPQRAANAALAAKDPFSARNWSPPPAPPPAVAEPSAPVAPPLPYAFIGKKQEAGSWEVFLMRGEQTFVVRASDVLEGQYRIELIQPPTMTLTYLPLGQVQTLPIGDTR
jgi:hypothetical protein